MQAPPSIHLAKNPVDQRRLAALARSGQLLRIAPRIYADPTADITELVRRHLLEILAFRYPDAVLAHRSAVSLSTDGDQVWLIAGLNQRNDGVGGITVHLLRGDTELGVDRIAPHLRAMSLERVLLESLAPTGGRGREKYLTREECERELLKVLSRGEQRLNALRDSARDLAARLDLAPGFDVLARMVSALLETHESDGVLVTESARARARGDPFDEACIGRCVALRDYLAAVPFPDRPAASYARAPWRSLAFFEAYFSNYIEGTELTIEEAEAVVFEGRDLPQRPGDSHDVRGTFALCGDYGEMCVVPDSPSMLLALLQDRHRVLLGGRPEHSPGNFKTRSNRAGATEFVSPEAVTGTLTRGYGLYASLAPGLRRSLFVHFLVTDVHPMADGNGRLARLMMNAELVSAGECKIVVPTVARDDYLNGQRLASRETRFRVMCKVLTELHGYTSSLPIDDYAELLAQLRQDQALLVPDEGLPRFSRVRARFRFEPDAARASGTG